MKKILKKSLMILVLLCSGLLILSACTSSSSLSNDEIKELINGDIEGVETEVTALEEDSKTATGEDAANLASDAYFLTHRLDDILGTFDGDVEAGYITDAERSDYETTIDGLKQKLATLTTDLTAKAGDKASDINTKAKALVITSTEDLDTLLEEDDKLATGFEAGLSSASESTRQTFKTLIDQRLDGINSALDDLDTMEENGVITADEKTSYEKDLKELRKRFDDLDYKLG